jgi:Co/Zn/Cd efflux system component
MAKGSTRVIIVALMGNLAIALAKFIASWISGSIAMLTEAIHSLVDTGDQVLLLVVLLEDFAALIGICFAAAGVIAASLLLVI